MVIALLNNARELDNAKSSRKTFAPTIKLVEFVADSR